jgi:hypothetical protein
MGSFTVQCRISITKSHKIHNTHISICLGITVQEQFNFATLLIPNEVHEHYINTSKRINQCLNNYFNGTTPTHPAATTNAATLSGYKNVMKEACWMNVSEHIYQQSNFTMNEEESIVGSHSNVNSNRN